MTNSNNPISCSKPSLCPDSKSLIRDTWEDADARSSYCVEIDKNRFIWFYQPRHHVALWSGCEMTWQFFLEFISHVPHCVSKRMWLRLLGFCVFLQSVRAILCVKANVVTIGLGFVGFYSQSVPYCVSKRMWLRLACISWIFRLWAHCPIFYWILINSGEPSTLSRAVNNVFLGSGFFFLSNFSFIK